MTLLGKDGSPVTFGAPGGRPHTVAPAAGVGLQSSYPPLLMPSAPVGCTFTLDTPGIAGTTGTAFEPSSG